MRDHLGRLDPVGRRWLPRRTTLLRLLAVAGLLLTAAAVLQTGPRDPAAPVAATSAPPATPNGPAGAAGLAGVSAADSPAGAAAGAAPVSSAPRLPIPAGLVGVPVRLADPTGLAVLVPGDRVDLLAVPAQGPPTALASAAPVLAVDRSAPALLLALSPAEAKLVVASPPEHPLAIIVR